MGDGEAIGQMGEGGANVSRGKRELMGGKRDGGAK